MAPKRNPAKSDSLNKKAANSSDPPQVLRRSARIRKRSVLDPDVSSPQELLEAARMLGDHVDKIKDRQEVKRVSFDEDQSPTADKPRVLKNLQSDNEAGDQPNSPALAWSTSSPFSGGLIHRRRSSVPPSPLDITTTIPRASLTPSRAARIRSLIASELSPGPSIAAGSKRLFDDDKDFDIDVQPYETKRSRDARKHPVSKIIQLPDDPNVFLLTEIERHPQYLSLTEISDLFLIIQDRIFGSQDKTEIGFAEKYFSYTLSPDQCAAWPLHELRTKYVPLYMTSRYVADGSQYGWRNFFTEPESRQHLAAAVLGEWFTQRIFKHTAFGFPQHLLDELEEKDREYLHYDAIVRSKERAKLIKQWYYSAPVRPAIADTTVTAADSLAEELLTVLQPLLPPPLFDPLETPPMLLRNGRKDSVALHREAQKRDARAQIKNDLFDLIMSCAALHKSIRLTGEDGIIVRMALNPQKGSLFHPTAPTACVNQQDCNATVPMEPSDPSELRIKMTCFPRVEAFRPEGPDMAELAFHEEGHRKTLQLSKALHGYEKAYSSAIANNSDPPPLTPFQENPPSPSPTSPSFPKLQFTWDNKETLWPIVPTELQDNEGRHAGERDAETGELKTLKRAAYVTLFPNIAPARVYCEWTPPQAAGTGQTLDEAIAEARASHPAAMKLRVEDLSIEAWNAWALYGGLAQWGVLSTALVWAVCSTLRVPQHLRGAVQRIVDKTGRALRASSQLTRLPIEHVPVVIVRKVIEVVRNMWARLGPFGPAMLGPVNTLLVEPAEAVYDAVRVGGGQSRVTAAVLEKLASEMCSAELGASILAAAATARSYAVGADVGGNEEVDATAATFMDGVTSTDQPSDIFTSTDQEKGSFAGRMPMVMSTPTPSMSLMGGRGATATLTSC